MSTDCIKMSARRSLAGLLGEPDHTQNKVDFKYWNTYFDNQFQSRWGIDPKRDLLDITRWKRVHEDEVPKAYQMPSLEWACNPKKRVCHRSTHLGLHGIGAGFPVSCKPLIEMNTNIVTTGAVTTSTRPVTPDPLLDHANIDVTPEATPVTSPSMTSSVSPSSSLKRKQTSIKEYFPNTKARTLKTAKRRLTIN